MSTSLFETLLGKFMAQEDLLGSVRMHLLAQDMLSL